MTTSIPAQETDKYNVGPKEYAEWAEIHPNTARKMFAEWFKSGKQFIRRRGVSTKRYPAGRDLVMSRAHFTKLSSITAHGQVLAN